MAEQTHSTEARERVLAAAERLFAQKGYASVTLRDIAAEVGIRHASLYHHVPGGKEELFIEVTERTLARHQAGLQAVIEAAPADVRSQLCAAAGWLISQPPMDLLRMVHSDMPAINKTHAERLEQLAYDTMIGPLERVLEGARARGEIRQHNLALVAGSTLGMIETLHAIPEYAVTESRESMAAEMIDVLLNGLRA